MAVALDLTGLVMPESLEEQSRSEDGRRAQFLLQPLERGFGHTIGNSIRRILLSALPGAAVWAFRADGVQHEHQAMEGVAEDIHQFIQNLKRLVLLLDPDIDDAKLILSVHEAGPVTAADITPHAGVEVVNGDHHLFRLQEDLPENRPANIDLWVNRGRGFVMAEQHELPEKAPVGMIRVDSFYNPVVRANFTVQETRVGQRTDFDRLVIDVETNGALDPQEAMRQAAEIARAHLAYLTHFGEAVQPGFPGSDGSGPGQGRRRLLEEAKRAALEKPLEAFEQISARSRNTLEKENIRLLADVAVRTRDQMLDVPNFGEKSLEELAEVLAVHGLHFGMKLERDDEDTLYLSEDSDSAGSESPEGQARVEQEAQEAGEDEA